eukprot:g3113.t1
MQNEITVASSQASGAFPMAAGQFATSSFCGDNPGPACIRVQGFCDPSQDGDYYKHPVCVSGQAQWSKIDGSLRIRYDGDERNGQAGKWVLETDVVDLMASSYGTEIARQPTFNPTPSLGDTIWNLKCRYPSNDGLGSFYIQYRTKIVELVSCTCDSQIDCNGAGVAIGSKENGPNCLCECSPDRAGDSCEIPLCQVPGVQNSLDPACEEGNWIYPNGVCTPSCQEGYQPNHPSFTCTADGTFLLPLGFTCDQIWVNEAPEGSAHEEEDHDNSSTLVPEHGLPSLQDEGTYTPEVRHSIGGLPGQVEVLALSGPGIRRGAEVILQNIVGRPELDGAHGWVTGLYEVDLEGVEILKMIPEYCLQDVELSAEPPAIMSAPGPEAADANWLVSMRDLENKVEASRQERYKKFASEQTKEATEREAREALQESAAVRADLEGRLRMGLRTGDAEMLREAIAEVHELLKQPYLAIAPPASLSSLQRVLETAESRLEQFDTIKDGFATHEDEECEAEKPQDEPLLVEVFPEAEKLDEESEPTGPRSFAPPIPEASPSQPDAVHPEDGTPEATVPPKVVCPDPSKMAGAPPLPMVPPPPGLPPNFASLLPVGPDDPGSLKVDLEVAHEAQADFFQAYEYARQQVLEGYIFLDWFAIPQITARAAGALLEADADPNPEVCCLGITPILSAVTFARANRNAVEIVELLIKYRANPNVRSRQTGFWIPVTWAARAQVALFGREACSFPTRETAMLPGETSLLKAASLGHEEMTEALLRHGAEMVPNDRGETPQGLAEANGHYHLRKVFETFTV